MTVSGAALFRPSVLAMEGASGQLQGHAMPVRHGVIPVHTSDPLIAPLLAASPERPFVIAQLGQSLDGRIATLSGESRWINGSAALDHLHRLRAHVDAVVVGAGTVVEDDPLLTVRRVRGRSPARIVIDPNGRAARSSKCFAQDGIRTMVVTTEPGSTFESYERLVVPREGDQIPPDRIVSALFAQGYRRILIEGGSKTVSAFIEAGAVQRLHVLVAPVILGSGIPGLSLAPIARLDDAIRPKTEVHVLDGGDVVFDCDLTQ